MAMVTGRGKRFTSEINLTPLIDVLLVLLIILMVIAPPAPKGLDALLPQPNPRPDRAPPESTIVIQVRADRTLTINQETVSEPRLGPRLREIFKTHAQRTAFVTGDENLDFRELARVIDIARGAGIDKVGLLTAGIERRF